MSFQSSLKNPFDSIGLFTYLRTYARRKVADDPNSLIESWEECITRVVNACNTQLHCDFTEKERSELFDLLYNLKGSVAGRFLWQIGTETVNSQGLLSLQNCAATVVNHPIDSFSWTMNFLFLGSGVGFRILPEDIEHFPILKSATITRKDTKDADYIVPDSREGWICLLRKVLKSHFYSGKGFSYSCTLLRSKGAPIKTFGGIASGPDILCEGMSKINTLLNKRAGLKLRPIDALDIMTIIGMIIVSGNVRRSALLALGDCNDLEFLRAKRWDLGNIPNTRCHSNNSIVCNDIEQVLNNEEFWEGYKGNGEPYGLINLDLMRKCGRLGETQYSDYGVECVNPCSEQTLHNQESCCLSELYLPHMKSEEELYKMTRYLYRICKHSLTLPCPASKETEEIVHKNMRMGVGVTGYLQATEVQRTWLKGCYQMLRAYDEYYSELKGFPISIKLTTVKPSGTLSLLGGVTSGVHPGFSRFYIRRIRISSNSSLIKLARDNGYPIEPQRRFDGTIDVTTMIISFPCRLPKRTILAKNCTAVQQLEYAKRLQTEWSDNSISITCYYKKEELEEIKAWLKVNYNDSVKSVSFLLHSEHGFDQAPLEEITKEQYLEMSSKCKNIDNVKGICYNEDDEYIGEAECAGGHCPLK